MPWITNKKEAYAIGVIGILHLIGTIGLLTKYQSYFEILTPLNLFVTFLLVILFTKENKKKLLIFFSIAFVIGMLVEIIGVATTFPFGEYYYTSLLGPMLFRVPIIIGINWFLLSYGIVSFFQVFFNEKPLWLKSVSSALLMTLTDFLIEPFAIRHNLWVWAKPEVPFQNYLSWFFISLIIFFFAFKLLGKERNNVAAFVIFIFVLFFSLNNFLSNLL